jgi:3-phosphoshikimate 1-carboxyvinyltransferase
VIILPAKKIRGQVQMPGDKSVSHRAAMIAALAEGPSGIRNFSTSADCNSTLSCLDALGVAIEREGVNLLISGVGIDGLREPEAALNCGNSGTTMRLLAGILAGQNFESTLTGDESLLSRPMARIIEPLQMMGASISSPDGHAPLVIHGRKPLQAIAYELLVASAQLKSSILLAGLNAVGRTEVIENEVTRDHTERMLREFGVQIESGNSEREGQNTGFSIVQGPAHFPARDISVPGDISSAAYFIAAAALLTGSSLQVSAVGVNPTRVLFLAQLRTLGLDVEITDVREESNEPVGVVRVDGSDGSERQTSSAKFDAPFLIQGSIVPQLIDELPLLAVVGSQIEGGIEIRDATELRVKESDRIATTAMNLKAMGAEVEEFDDGLRVSGQTQLRGAKIDPRGDHRIAMAFTVAGLIADGETEIEDAKCVGVSFPGFFELLDSVVER